MACSLCLQYSQNKRLPKQWLMNPETSRNGCTTLLTCPVSSRGRRGLPRWKMGSRFFLKAEAQVKPCSANFQETLNSDTHCLNSSDRQCKSTTAVGCLAVVYDLPSAPSFHRVATAPLTGPFFWPFWMSFQETFSTHPRNNIQKMKEAYVM